MRDEARIDKVLATVGKVWHANPDLRLGQLLLNVAKDSGPNGPMGDLYYVEDDAMVVRLKMKYR